MDVVIRAVNQRFLDEVAFPVLAGEPEDRRRALARLGEAIADHETRTRIEGMIERHAAGEWADPDVERFQELAYELLFSEWTRTETGWTPALATAYGGGLDETVHLALMVTSPDYPYWDADAARLRRREVASAPWTERGLAGFVSGVWDGCPAFVPGDVLATRGTNVFDREGSVALADWCYRGREAVSKWNLALPRCLRTLMEREVQRLRPIEVPEAREVLDYWLGAARSPPQLVVAFSGLGPSATQWVRQIGELAARLRAAASREQALTAVITGPRGDWV